MCVCVHVCVFLHGDVLQRFGYKMPGVAACWTSQFLLVLRVIQRSWRESPPARQVRKPICVAGTLSGVSVCLSVRRICTCVLLDIECSNNRNNCVWVRGIYYCISSADCKRIQPVGDYKRRKRWRPLFPCCCLLHSHSWQFMQLEFENHQLNKL